MPYELVDMEKATPFDRLRLALVGHEKTGKSRLAATGRKGVFVFDWDGRRESLAGMKGVKAVTLIDPGDISKVPTAFTDGLNMLTQLEYKRSFSNLGFKGVPPEEDTIQTVVVDSVYSIAKAARTSALYNAVDMRRTLKIGSMQVFLTGGWDGWNAEMGLVEQFIMRLLAIPKLDLILVFHETAEEMPGSTAEKRSYSGRYDIFPGRYGNLLKYMNEVWRVTRQNSGAPKIQRDPDFQFQAASNLGNIPDVGADIDKMITAYLAKNLVIQPTASNEKPGVLELPSAVVAAPPGLKGVS
jgi:hypothetical protein